MVGLLFRAMETLTGHSVIEVARESEALASAMLPSARVFNGVDTAWFQDPVHGEMTIDAGYAHTPHTDEPWRIDWMGRGGYRVWQHGGGGIESASRYRASLLFGAGLTFDSTIGFRPEVGVTFDHQQTVSPISGRIIPTGRRHSIDLTVATLHREDSTAAEMTVVLHAPPWGGVFARAGYEWMDDPMTKSGRTWMVGLRFDTVPASFLVMTAVVGALVEAVKGADWSLPSSTKN